MSSGGVKQTRKVSSTANFVAFCLFCWMEDGDLSVCSDHCRAVGCRMRGVTVFLGEMGVAQVNPHLYASGPLAVFSVVRPPVVWPWEGSNYPSWSCNGLHGPKGPKLKNKPSYSWPFGCFSSRWFTHPCMAFGGVQLPLPVCNGPNGPKRPKLKKNRNHRSCDGPHGPKGSKFKKQANRNHVNSCNLAVFFFSVLRPLLSGLWRSPITPFGPAMVLMDLKNLN